MSSDGPTTRERILEGALTLLRNGDGPIGMAAIAKAAGVSRQTLYLVFQDRGDLFIALVRHVDQKRGLEDELSRIRNAPTGVEALMRMVDLQARQNPNLKPLVDAMELLRRQDPAVERGWQDRLDNRLAGCREIVRRIAAEGALREDIEPDVAADLVWSLTSLRMWDDLVAQRGWSAEKYRQGMESLLKASLLRPDAPSAS